MEELKEKFFDIVHEIQRDINYQFDASTLWIFIKNNFTPKAIQVQAKDIMQLAEVKKEFETKFLDGHNLDTLESEGFDKQDIDDIRELWIWFSNKLSKLSE